VHPVLKKVLAQFRFSNHKLRTEKPVRLMIEKIFEGRKNSAGYRHGHEFRRLPVLG
jgi:hypothetical protein